MAILVSTRNPHKLREFREMFEGTKYRLVSIDEVPGAPEVEEDGDTFRANADKKARTLALFSGHITIADDSGIEIDALDRRPGVYSARYAGVEGPGADAANNAKMIEELTGVPDAQRTARYRCSLAVVRPDGEARYADGTCEGGIGHEARGEGGFGYDPWFLVGDGSGRTMAELSSDEKHAISHRGAATAGLLPLLDDLTGG
ncbi:MAG: RdgB/HAM1 family non-canonical purine NTP pyrophosphatase [Deltaproteobacteria bacterium]|nr:RdgB/HAM1 family non-canonical purine NTP pyrophosphatase [Deltaproteobacteria bacterium]